MAFPSYKALIAHYGTTAPEVQFFFKDLPELLRSSFGWEVVIAYQFIRLETGLNRTLYGGVVKLHRADANTADSKLGKLHITRDSFPELFKNVYGAPLPASVTSKIKFAETIRDRCVHGKRIAEPDARTAVADVLDYASALNFRVFGHASFYPFGDMRGFKGAAQPLPPDTTYWLLKGMGI
jgi:hypothetical protein